MKCIGCNATLPFMESEPKSFDCLFCDKKQYPDAVDLLSHAALGFVNEVRTGQIELAEKIGDNLRDGGASLYEAGTGVGKSFAYLLPAILEGKRIVISTAKRTLQAQLLEKDLPYVRERLRQLGHPRGEFNFAPAYGKSNYACYLKAKREKENSKDWSKYEKFFKQTEYGRFEEGNKLHLHIDRSLSAEDCIGIECKYYKSECGYVAARKEMLEANVVVTNNWLLGFHYKLRREMPHFYLLGEFDHVIVDEAHKVEDGIRSAFTHETNLHFVDVLKKQFDKLQDAAERRITLPELTALEPVWKSTFKELDNIHRSKTHVLTPKALALVSDVKARMEQIGDILLRRDYLDNVFIHSTTAIHTLLLTRYLAASNSELPNVVDETNPALDLSSNVGFPRDEGDQARFIALDRLLTSIKACRTTFDFILNCPPNRTWTLETTLSKGYKNFVLKSIPVNIGAYLPDKKITYLSATLAIGENDFSAFAERVGLARKPYNSAVFESPFDLRKQAHLFAPLPSTMPEPDGPRGSKDPNVVNLTYAAATAIYRDALAEHVYQLIFASQGDAFVLFRAKADLDHVKAFVYSKMFPYPIFSQTDLTAEDALAQFRLTPKSTVFGLNSFWEGVDIPGNKLSLVIITKLPFPMKDDPVVSAKTQEYEDAGLGHLAFSKINVPEMLFELRQGIGRLIRTKKDRGIIAILDSRVHSRVYGKTVLNMIGMHPNKNLENVCRGLATRHAGKSTDRSSEP